MVFADIIRHVYIVHGTKTHIAHGMGASHTLYITKNVSVKDNCKF